MRTGKRILFGFMLTFLLVVSAVAAIVIVAHLDIGGDAGDSVLREPATGDRRNASGTDLPIGDDEQLNRVQPITDPGNFSGWQRAIEKPEGSDYWHYFPLISQDYSVGDTVVLSATSDDFIGWEVDGLSDFVESEDDGYVHISFTLPESDFNIAALYSEIPFGNFNSSEHTADAFYTSIEPLSGPFIPITPSARVGEFFNVEILLEMLEQHLKGLRDLSSPIWAVAIFIVWLKELG